MIPKKSMSNGEEGVATLPRPPLIGNWHGVTVRRRTDPGQSTVRDLYHCHRRTKHSIRGIRVYFTIFRGQTPLYSTKMKGRRPSYPLPIARGGEMHYTSSEFAAYLLSGNNHTQFSLRVKTAFGNEVLSVSMCHTDGDRTLPKTVSVYFFLKDSLIPQKLVSRRAAVNADGEWCLNFGNRLLIPSVRNCILAGENDIEFICIRKVGPDQVDVDAASIVSPLAVFGVVLALFECTI
jgi:hypothetical protein